MNDFDREVERELRRLLDPIMAVRVPPPPAAPRMGIMTKLLGGAGAAIAAKAVLGVALLAIAAAGTGAATEVAITGSMNPADWGVLSAHHSVVVVGAQRPAVTSTALPTTAASNAKPAEPVNVAPAAAQASPAPAPVNVAPKLAAPSSNSPTRGCGPSAPDLQSGC